MNGCRVVAGLFLDLLKNRLIVNSGGGLARLQGWLQGFSYLVKNVKKVAGLHIIQKQPCNSYKK